MSRAKRILAAISLTVSCSALLAASASAEFGLSSYDVQIAANPPSPTTNTKLAASGGAYTQAGGHPYSIVTHIEWNNHLDSTTVPPGLPAPDGDLRDSSVALPVGLIGNPTGYPQCTARQLSGRGPFLVYDPAECPADSQVGVIRLASSRIAQLLKDGDGGSFTFPLYNMVPPAGSPGALWLRRG